MRNYRVKWRKSALNDLADIWLQSSDRNGVTLAEKEIESRLEDAPMSWGRELSEGLRSFTWKTLRGLFYVVEETNIVRTVSVTSVRGQG